MRKHEALEPEQLLANAIIEQAAEDYRTSLRGLKINPRNREKLTMKEDCERFFQSDWFEMLTKLDGAYLMRRLREEVIGK